MTTPLYDIPLSKIDGSAATLKEHAGEVLLITNVASKCGLTPQYAGLEKLYETYRGKKFAVLGFPANDFAGQEPGSNEEIQAFCDLTYKVAVSALRQDPRHRPGQAPALRPSNRREA